MGFLASSFCSFAMLDQILKETHGTKSRFFTWIRLCCWMAFSRDVLDDRINSSRLLHSRFPIQWTLCTFYLPDSKSMHRLIALPAAFTLIEAVRYRWPFGGVPLATIAMSQSDSPFGQTARVLGPLFLTAFVIICGMAFAMLWEKEMEAYRCDRIESFSSFGVSV